MGREGRARTQGGRDELGADPATTGGQRSMTTDTTAAAREALLAWDEREQPIEPLIDRLIATVRAESDATDVTIGPIQHSNSMCQKEGCTCWCQACERHNCNGCKALRDREALWAKFTGG